MRDVRAYWEVKTSAVQRYLLWHYAIWHTGYVYISEFPKSGGTWLSNLLSDVLEIPFYQHRMIPISERGVFLSHYNKPPGNKRTIILVRDGRDVMVSAYFHFIRPYASEENFVSDTVKYWRRALGDRPYQNVEESLPLFIDLFNKDFRISGRRVNWAGYYKGLYASGNDSLIWCTYESLSANGEKTIADICERLHVDYDTSRISQAINKFAFGNTSDPKVGDSKDGFLRKGVVGDWKNYFSVEACEIFARHCGDELIKMGYETDNSWIKQ